MTTPVTKVTVLSSKEQVLAFKMMTGICVVMALHVAIGVFGCLCKSCIAIYGLCAKVYVPYVE